MTRRKKRKIDYRNLPREFQHDPSIPPMRVVVLTKEVSIVQHDVAEAFESAGHQVMRLRYEERGNDEVFEGAEENYGRLLDRVMKFGPHLIVAINAMGVGHSEVFPALAEIERIPLVSWFVDFPPVWLPRMIPPECEYTLLASYDESQLDFIRSMGYRHVEHLPLGTTPRKFPLPPGHPIDDHTYPLGYAGNLFTTLRTHCRKYLDKCAAKFDPDTKKVIETLFREGLERFASADVPSETAWEWLNRVGPEQFSDRELLFRPVAQYLSPGHYLAPLISHSAAAERRQILARELDNSGLHVWGGEDWKQTLSSERCHPYKEYDGLFTVYQDCRVNLSLSHVQNVDSVTQRLFDVPACGGFLLSDWRPCMEKLFEVGEELVVFRSLEEARELAERYGQDHKARNLVVERARRRVMAEHTYAHRVERLAQMAVERWPEILERPRRRKTVAMTSPPGTASRLLGIAASELVEEDLDRPAAPILEALVNEPEAQGTMARLEGVEAFRTGDPGRALELFREALSLGEDRHHSAQFSAGSACLKVEGPAAALPYFRAAARLWPKSSQYWTSLAGCRLQLQDWGRARADLERALFLNPDNEAAARARRAFADVLDPVEPVWEDEEDLPDPERS